MAIAQKATQCALSLERIVQETLAEDARQEWENQMFRFNLWSANNFVFAATRASMDWRLRNAPLLETSMCELLDDLQSSLIRHIAIMRSPRDADETNQNTLVSETLEELFRLSRAVRRSGILRRFVKIESYIEIDESGVNLTEEFRRGVERLLEFRLKDSAASQRLRECVVDTICLRQQHFAYLQAKWAKGTVRQTALNPAPVQPRSSLGATFSVRGSIKSSPRRTKKKEPVAVPTVMTATTARPERMKVARSLKSAVSADHEDVECSQEDLPSPPIIPPGAREYECPFCYVVCSSSEFSGERWKKHVIQDIMPFFCIFDDCPTTNTLFESGRDWLKHMRERHVVTGWTCMDQSHSTTLIFDTECVFKDHMHCFHAGEFHGEELDDIAAASSHRLPMDELITACPFCPTDLGATIPADAMMSHVAGHMFSFAHISVSWQMDGETSDLQSSFASFSTHRSEGGRRNYFMTGQCQDIRVVTKDGEAPREEQHDPDFPEFNDDTHATDTEYTPGEAYLPEGDAEFFDSLWRSVRQELEMPALAVPTQSVDGHQEPEEQQPAVENKFTLDASEMRSGDADDDHPSLLAKDSRRRGEKGERKRRRTRELKRERTAYLRDINLVIRDYSQGQGA